MTLLSPKVFFQTANNTRVLFATGCLLAKLYVMTFQELDELVYALYGLTPEEIKIVEGAK